MDLDQQNLTIISYGVDIKNPPPNYIYVPYDEDIECFQTLRFIVEENPFQTSHFLWSEELMCPHMATLSDQVCIGTDMCSYISSLISGPGDKILEFLSQKPPINEFKGKLFYVPNTGPRGCNFHHLTSELSELAKKMQCMKIMTGDFLFKDIDIQWSKVDMLSLGLFCSLVGKSTGQYIDLIEDESAAKTLQQAYNYPLEKRNKIFSRLFQQLSDNIPTNDDALVDTIAILASELVDSCDGISGTMSNLCHIIPFSLSQSLCENMESYPHVTYTICDKFSWDIEGNCYVNDILNTHIPPLHSPQIIIFKDKNYICGEHSGHMLTIVLEKNKTILRRKINPGRRIWRPFITQGNKLFYISSHQNYFILYDKHGVEYISVQHDLNISDLISGPIARPRGGYNLYLQHDFSDRGRDNLYSFARKIVLDNNFRVVKKGNLFRISSTYAWLRGTLRHKNKDYLVVNDSNRMTYLYYK